MDAFDLRGRLSRRAYGRILIRTLAVAAGLLCLAIWAGSSGWRGTAILVLAGNLPVLLALAAATVRRLHDRERSGGWLGLYAVLYLGSFAPIDAATDRHPVAAIAATVAMVGFFLWFFVETILRRGTPGPNRFGPEPGSALAPRGPP